MKFEIKCTYRKEITYEIKFQCLLFLKFFGIRLMVKLVRLYILHLFDLINKLLKKIQPISSDLRINESNFSIQINS